MWYLFFHPTAEPSSTPGTVVFNRSDINWLIARNLDDAVTLTWFNGMPRGIWTGPIPNEDCEVMEYLRFLKDCIVQPSDLLPVCFLVDSKEPDNTLLDKFIHKWWQETLITIS